jgi:hypothetical protein
MIYKNFEKNFSKFDNTKYLCDITNNKLWSKKIFLNY